MSDDYAEDAPGMTSRCGMIAIAFCILGSGWLPACAQEAPAKESALRLPDGTIIFYTKNPLETMPAIDGVLLTAKDYKNLLDQAEQLKKAKATAKPVAPSVCHIRCTVNADGDRPAAILAIKYQFQTTAPNTAVFLGGQRAFAVSASLNDAGPPVLEATADGLTAWIESSGEHTLTLTLAAPVTPRNKGDLGFELGLPRAAITTLAFTVPPAVNAPVLGTRLPDAAGKPGEMKTTAIDAKRFAVDSQGAGVPLGPTDVLEFNWDSPGSAPLPTEASLEVDAAIRIEDRSIETTATLKLRGPNREWTLVLPPVMVLALATPSDTVRLTGPIDPKVNAWTVTLPSEMTEATLTATLKQPRPESKAPANFAFGPLYARGTVRTGGTLRVFAPFTVRVVPKAAAELRRVDVAAVTDDSPVATFRFANLMTLDKKASPLLEYELRPATAFVVAQPQHKLTLTPLGWRLRSLYRISPVRTALEQIAIELPAGWQDPTFAPLDLIDEVQGGGDATTSRTLTLRLATPQRDPFELTLETRFPLAMDAREASLSLPRLTMARERDTQVTASVIEPLAVTGTVREWDGAKIAAVPGEFTAIAAETLSGRFDGGVARVDLAWQAAKPRYAADITTDVLVTDRQAVVAQTFKFAFPDDASRTVLLRGPATVAGFRSTPSLESTGPGEWSLPVTAKTASLSLSYAVPVTTTAAWTVPMIGVDAATVTTTVRVGGTVTGRRVNGFEGPWREVPPEPIADRDTLPWLTLKGTGSVLPLTLAWADADATGSVIVERAVHQWMMAEEGPSPTRSRFLLKRWPATLETEVPGSGPVTVFVDRQRVEPVLLRSERTAIKTIAILLPEAKAGRTTVLIELRFHTDGTTLIPPAFKGAVNRTGAWWQITPTPGTLPLTLGPLNPELSWRWHDGLLTPLAGVSDDALEKWLTDPAEIEPTTGTQSVTGWQTRPAAVRYFAIPRMIAFFIGTVVSLLTGFGLSRLTINRLAVLVAIIIIAVTIAVLLVPQPLAQIAVAVQPGLLITIVALALTAAVRSWRRTQAARRATFSRGPVPVTPAPSTPPIDLSAKVLRGGSSLAAPVSQVN